MIESLGNVLTSGWLYSTLLWIAVGSTVIIIGVILSENRNPVKSLAWVTILLLLPVAGIVLYFFFGRNIKNKRMISRRERRRLRRRERRVKADPREAGLSEASVQQVLLGRSLTGAQFYPDNTVEFFASGAEKFEALKADLRAARKSINLQYYIFSDDETGRDIADILVAKAAEGVAVRVIYDHVGSLGTSNSFFRRLKRGGVEASPFFKVTFPLLGTHINWRNHRKIVVVDDAVAYVGGMNIADRYSHDRNGGRRWRDTHLRLRGPVVAALQYSFAVDWNFTGGGLIELCQPDAAEAVETEARGTAIGGVCAQLITSGPTNQWSNVSMSFHKAIANARRRVYIQTPYFLPTEGLLRALESAALAHVDVRLMMPERSDSAMLTYASASYIAECLRAGIKVYLYKPGMLHSKMLLVDDELVSVGSTNFDFRSFDYNFEANIFLYGREANAAADELFKADMAECRRVQPGEWRHRPLTHKIAESVLRLLSPIL